MRVGGAELQDSFFQVAALTPPLSREPGEGVSGSRPNQGLFGAENAEIGIGGNNNLPLSSSDFGSNFSVKNASGGRLKTGGAGKDGR